MSKYEIIYQKNKKIHKLLLEQLPSQNELPENIISIREIKKLKLKNIELRRSKDLFNFFYELNTMLQANLTILDSILILKKNSYDSKTTRIINIFYSSLLNGTYIHQGLNKEDFTLKKIIIEFIKIGEVNGNIKQSINSITSILEENIKNKKRLISSFSYPIVLLVTLFISVSSIFTFVIPKFETLYEQYKGDLPLSTQYLLYLKSFFDNYFLIFVFIVIMASFIFISIYKKSTNFKQKLDKFLITKIPLLSKMFLVSNSSNFFFCLSTLLNDKHQFYDSLKNSKTLVSNSYLFSKISQIEKEIKDGKSISQAFEESLLFDDLTLRLINTGEKSNNLTLTLSRIDNIYKEKLNNTLKNFIAVFQPTVIAIIAGFILWLVTALFTPLWDISSVMK